MSHISNNVFMQLYYHQNYNKWGPFQQRLTNRCEQFWIVFDVFYFVYEFSWYELRGGFGNLFITP